MIIKLLSNGQTYTAVVNYNILQNRKELLSLNGSTKLGSGIWIPELNEWLKPNTFEVIKFEDEVQRKYFIEAGLM